MLGEEMMEPWQDFWKPACALHADGGEVFHPVGYVEGWYAAENWWQQGIRAKVLRAAEDWARSQGCIEIAVVRRSITKCSNLCTRRWDLKLPIAGCFTARRCES